MELTVLAGGTSLEKAQGVVGAFPGIWVGDVLDVGCRRREMEVALSGHPVNYVGLDISPGSEIEADIGQEIPLPDRAVDVVTALDVLEHADDFHRAFAEVCRVARRNIVITLPNCFEIATRVRVMMGHEFSDKYGLPTEPPADRHRWFFSMEDARAFLATNAPKHGWELAEERAMVGPKRARFAALVRRWPNVGSGTYLCLLTRAG